MTLLRQNKRFTIIVFAVALLLLTPLIAMQFTNEVKWTVVDFLGAGGLLLGAGLACEIILRKVKDKKLRLVICSVALAVLLLIWLELAVGIFGTALAGS